MAEVEGVCWRYCQGLGTEGVPSFQTAHGLRPLPGMLRKHTRVDTSVCLRQAVALLTRQTPPPLRNPRGSRRHDDGWEALIPQVLPDYRVTALMNPQGYAVLHSCQAAHLQGGLALVQWCCAAQAPRWVLVVGIEERWQPTAVVAAGTAQALLALDTGTAPVWRCGHNLHLQPEAPTRAGTALLAWKLCTLQGEVARGTLGAATVIVPARGQRDR